MPRIIITGGSGASTSITLDERVTPSELSATSNSVELIERIGWAVHDAEETDEALESLALNKR